MARPDSGPALILRDVTLIRDNTTIVHELNWEVHADQRWVVLGANGSGKTSLVSMASLYTHPSSGEIEILGERLGRTDVRVLRRSIGLASSTLRDQLRPDLTCADVVMTQKFARRNLTERGSMGSSHPLNFFDPIQINPKIPSLKLKVLHAEDGID